MKILYLGWNEHKRISVTSQNTRCCSLFVHTRRSFTRSMTPSFREDVKRYVNVSHLTSYLRSAGLLVPHVHLETFRENAYGECGVKEVVMKEMGLSQNRYSRPISRPCSFSTQGVALRDCPAHDTPTFRLTTPTQCTTHVQTVGLTNR